MVRSCNVAGDTTVSRRRRQAFPLMKSATHWLQAFRRVRAETERRAHRIFRPKIRLCSRWRTPVQPNGIAPT